MPFIALCLPVADMMHPNTMISILNGGIPRPAVAIMARGKDVFTARNELVRDALSLEGDLKVTHLLWIDDDMVFRGDAVERLLAHDLDIVGGLCFNRHHPYNPILLYEPPKSVSHLGAGYLYRYEWPQPPGLLEVDATGAAFLLVKRAVYEKIAEKLGPGEGPFSQLGLGEDVSFCRRARAVGFKVFVDTSIEIGHVGEVVVARSFADRNRQIKLNEWTPTIEVTKCGLRILGDEETPDGVMHRARYRWAGDVLAASQRTSGGKQIDRINYRVLDFGCGTGHGTDVLRTMGFDAIGFDPDKDAIAWGREHWNLGDVIDSNDATVFFGRWDAIVAFEVMEHRPTTFAGQFSEFFEHAPIVIGSFPFDEPAGANPHHVHHNLTPDVVRSQLSGQSIEFFVQRWDGTIEPWDGVPHVGQPPAPPREVFPILLFVARRA